MDDEKETKDPDDTQTRKDASSHTYPSELVVVNIKGTERVYPVWIPERELFRVRNIIEEKEYAVPGIHNRKGPLLVWDVGANVGLFAVYMKLVAPQSRIHCFELSAPTLALLKRNVGTLEGVTIHAFGLFNKEDQMRLSLDPVNTGGNSVKNHHGSYGGSVLATVKEAGRLFDTLGVEDLDILKIDTEGCEVEILESLGERLKRIDVILAEYHSEEDRRRIDAILSDFRLFGAKVARVGLGTVKYANCRLL